MDAGQTEVEHVVRAACESQDFQTAATCALEAYGAEILSFLSARLRSGSDGDEAFSIFAEDLWKGLPGFAFRCSVRGFMYTLARNAANRYTRLPHNRRLRNLPVTGHGSLSALVDRVRSATQVHMRTDVKDKVRSLREQLSQEDQTLLILYLDRNLPWREIAMVLHEDGPELDDAGLAREAARLRKRFERVKSELREMASKAGLLKS